MMSDTFNGSEHTMTYNTTCYLEMLGGIFFSISQFGSVFFFFF